MVSVSGGDTVSAARAKSDHEGCRSACCRAEGRGRGARGRMRKDESGSRTGVGRRSGCEEGWRGCDPPPAKSARGMRRPAPGCPLTQGARGQSCGSLAWLRRNGHRRLFRPSLAFAARGRLLVGRRARVVRTEHRDGWSASAAPETLVVWRACVRARLTVRTAVRPRRLDLDHLAPKLLGWWQGRP